MDWLRRDKKKEIVRGRTERMVRLSEDLAEPIKIGKEIESASITQIPSISDIESLKIETPKSDLKKKLEDRIIDEIRKSETVQQVTTRERIAKQKNVEAKEVVEDRRKVLIDEQIKDVIKSEKEKYGKLRTWTLFQSLVGNERFVDRARLRRIYDAGEFIA